MKKIIIAAVAENGVIGKDGDIPWHYPEDLKHFKQKTTSNTVVMGRKTYQSLPSGFKPLPNRENIVLTNSEFDPENESVKIANSLNEAWEKASNENVFIIGGAGIYSQTIDEADRLTITRIHEEYNGDTYFPDWDEENWEQVKKERREQLSFVEYKKL